MSLPPIDHPSAEPQTLDEIREWNRGVVDALLGQRASVQDAIRTGSGVSPRFVGMTEDDVERHYDAQRRELDRLTVLNLVASAEAAVKVDYFRRVGNRLKDALSVAYQDWHKTLSTRKRLRPDFDEGGILDLIKEAGVMDNHIVGEYRECLRARHWIGHGRYWAKPAEVDGLDLTTCMTVRGRCCKDCPFEKRRRGDLGSSHAIAEVGASRLDSLVD